MQNFASLSRRVFELLQKNQRGATLCPPPPAWRLIIIGFHGPAVKGCMLERHSNDELIFTCSEHVINRLLFQITPEEFTRFAVTMSMKKMTCRPVTILRDKWREGASEMTSLYGMLAMARIHHIHALKCDLWMPWITITGWSAFVFVCSYR